MRPIPINEFDSNLSNLQIPPFNLSQSLPILIFNILKILSILNILLPMLSFLHATIIVSLVVGITTLMNSEDTF